jgi:hypothetical protein
MFQLHMMSLQMYPTSLPVDLQCHSLDFLTDLKFPMILLVVLKCRHKIPELRNLGLLAVAVQLCPMNLVLLWFLLEKSPALLEFQH